MAEIPPATRDRMTVAGVLRSGVNSEIRKHRNVLADRLGVGLREDVAKAPHAGLGARAIEHDLRPIRLFGKTFE